MLEVLVVIVVIAIMLGIGGAYLAGTSKSQARRAAKAELIGMLVRARSHAITSNQPTAIAFMPYQQGPEDLRGTSSAIFQVRENEATQEYESVRQVRRWERLAKRMIMTPSNPLKANALNAFAQEPNLEVTVSDRRGGLMTVKAPTIIFSPTGRVIHPAGSGELELHLNEGVIRNGTPTALKKSKGAGQGVELQDVILLSRTTGRARIINTVTNQ